ncbi:MAG TPA: D-aminoacyl-tRNA deacylase [Bacillota bacterium]
MRAVVQRVTRAAVSVAGEPPRTIGAGFVVLLGVGADDAEADALYIAEKICHLRVFPDDEGKMNRSLLEVGGEALIVSQFTLYGDVRRGRRPSFAQAAPPEQAEALYRRCVDALVQAGVRVETGWFQQHMEVEIHNDGPVTILIDSKKAF